MLSQDSCTHADNQRGNSNRRHDFNHTWSLTQSREGMQYHLSERLQADEQLSVWQIDGNCETSSGQSIRQRR